MSKALEAIRTPDERFAGLAGFPWKPNYLEGLDVAPSLRLHYLDEGLQDAEHTYLCLHGEPTWSYLYRKMIPVFLQAGGRIVAPDFFGFGRSDKPVDDAVYTFGFHRDTILQVVQRLELKRVTLVCQDWGGLIGLTLPVDAPELVARLIVMNTALGVGVRPTKGFLEWRDFVANNPDFDVGRLMRRSIPDATDEVIAAYEAPFPDARSKAGVRRFPAIVPIEPDMEGAAVSQKAAQWWSQQWSGPSFMAVGVQDPVLGPKVMELLRGLIKGCPEPLLLPDAGHFVQEQGDVVARAALQAFG